jgi:hypothetical protein
MSRFDLRQAQRVARRNPRPYRDPQARVIASMATSMRWGCHDAVCRWESFCKIAISFEIRCSILRELTLVKFSE